MDTSTPTVSVTLRIVPPNPKSPITTGIFPIYVGEKHLASIYHVKERFADYWEYSLNSAIWSKETRNLYGEEIRGTLDKIISDLKGINKDNKGELVSRTYSVDIPL